ncbi:uncharacterized protein LOC114291829 [Camellia sinensis]|uniref:uncharacterized protein LOC114291829 n=1 Tax=Camellia sinensis TaxID=4442 RepID=UPI001035DC99|nr:uncharacterized protein LOC114291829 [Camellia sinensis]
MCRVGPESRGSHHPELKVPFVSVLPGTSLAFLIEVSSEYSPIPAQQFPASPAYVSLPPEDPDEDPEEDLEESFDLGLQDRPGKLPARRRSGSLVVLDEKFSGHDKYDFGSGEMTVTQYVAKFEELARYAAQYVANEGEKTQKFEWGLDPIIRGRVLALCLPTFVDVVGTTLDAEREWADSKRTWMMKTKKRGQSFVGPRRNDRRNVIGHKKSECPQLTGIGNQAGGSGANAQVIGGQRPWMNKSGGATGGNRKVGPTGNQKATGRVFAFQEEDDEDPSVIRGLECEPLETTLCVASPLGESIRWHRQFAGWLASLIINEEARLELNLSRVVCRGCELEVSGLHLSCDLRVMNMSDFDIILGMDWLSAHRAMIDCYHKRVTVCTPSGTCFQFKGDKKDSLSTINRKMQWHRQFAGWLASLIINEEARLELNLSRVVREYADVFPEELPRLPPYRDVDFSIELQAGTAPISLTPYHMVPAELWELKTQLQELLEKGFIRLSISPWEAPVLFAKKKDGTLRLCIDYRQLN